MYAIIYFNYFLIGKHYMNSSLLLPKVPTKYNLLLGTILKIKIEVFLLLQMVMTTR